MEGSNVMEQIYNQYPELRNQIGGDGTGGYD